MNRRILLGRITNGRQFAYTFFVKVFRQLIVIIAFALVGTLLSYLLSLIHFPFPGSLIGMVLLFVFLLVGGVKSDSIHEVGQFFIDNMGIFFVPGAVAILNNLAVVSAIWWKLLIIILGGFVISFTATYFAVRLTLYLQNKAREKKEAKQND